MNLREVSKKEGFGADYLLPVPQYADWTHRRNSGAFAPQADYIAGDAAAAYPWANALWLLIWPYAPVQGHVSGYYFASNASYHAMMRLQRALKEQGIASERAAVPVKPILTQWGIGSVLENDLVFLPGFGTRFVVQALMLALPPEDLAFTPKREPFSACIHCHRCGRFCPGGAIGGRGFDWRKCLRAFEEGPEMPQWVMEKLTCLLGCEVCQQVCPLNHPFPPRALTEAEAEALSLQRLIAGDVGDALTLIGKNMKKGGKLTAQAAVLAANENRQDLLAALEQACEKAQSPLKETLLWAISHLKNQA